MELHLLHHPLKPTFFHQSLYSLPNTGTSVLYYIYFHASIAFNIKKFQHFYRRISFFFFFDCAGKRLLYRKASLLGCRCSSSYLEGPVQKFSSQNEGRRALMGCLLAAAAGISFCEAATAVSTSRRAVHYVAKWKGITFMTSRQGLGVGGGTPYGFDVGDSERGTVLKGLDLGVEGMRVGGQRLLIVPPELAYGNKGVQEIPPNATIEYIGKVKHAVFHTQKAARKRVVVSTEENVVASLDLRHGEICGYCHIFADVITLSSGGSVLRAWNLPDGQMVWESTLLGSKASKPLLLIPTNLKVNRDNVLFVYGNGFIHAVATIDGEVIWKKELASEGVDVQQLIYPDGSDTLYAVGLLGLSQFDVYQLDVKSGELLRHYNMLFPAGFSGDLSFVSDDTAVAMDSTGTALVAMHFQDGQISFHQTDVSQLIQDFSGGAVILPSKIAGSFILKLDSSIVFIKVRNDGKLEVVGRLGHADAVSDALSLSDGQQAFSLIQHGDGKIILTVKLSNDWTSNVIEETTQMDHQRGLVHKVFINSYVRTDRSNGFRALIVMEDHSLLLLQQGEIVWTREDGLASIMDVKASELPVEKDGVSVAKVEHNLFEWLKGHLLKLKGTLMIATPDDVAAIQKMRLQSSEKSKMTRDRNGFRKLLIVLTRAGKLFALHTGDGRIVWSLLLNTLRKSETCENPRGISLHQWQDPHHHALDENPSVLVVGRCGHTSDSAGVLSIVDTYTGEERNHMGPVHSIAHIIPLPFSDSMEQRLHLLVDANGHAHLYPRSAEALGIFQRELGNIYWYSAETDKNILRGHGVRKNCVLEVSDEFCFDTRDLWSIVFPSESEKIAATATRCLNEVVHTQAKVTADQEVMYKFISKNLLFLATVAPKAVGPIGSVTPDESSLVVYVIDTVTGRILHRMTHHGSQGPVQAVFSENWVVYHYFNLRAHRYEMSVIEIYDQARADNKEILKLVLGTHNLTSPITAYSRPKSSRSHSLIFSHIP
ncbi:hypothetical protein DH2020_018021 [Rehmannia glutinosa]|uniref:peptidylprolyl isomerase n=1 Tax=Rehmannia glutinosa TaxID=99300 RepID=A0ABR0WLX6_REHGL